MGDEEKPQDGDIQEEVETPNADGTQEGEPGEDGKPTEGNQPEGKKSEEPNDADDGSEPPVREKSKKDYIIERQAKKIEKLKGGKAPEKGDEPDDGEEDDDISPEDERLVDKVLEKRFGKDFVKKLGKLDQLDEVIQSSQRQTDEKEILDTISENPELKEFEAKARRFWAHPSRNHLPFLTVLYEVAGSALLKKGAQMEREAGEEADKTKVPGSNGRGNGAAGKKTVSEMTDEEFLADKARVLGHL